MPVAIPYDPAKAETICDRVVAGDMMKDVMEDVGLSRSTLARWQAINPLFARALDAARTEAAHAFVELARESAEEDEPKKARNKIHVLLFAAERLNRAKYGASVDMTLTQTVELGGTLIEARKRLLLPGSDLAPALPVHHTDYIDVTAQRTTDCESVSAMPAPDVDPFS